MRHKVRTSEYQRSFQGPAKEYCKSLHDELAAYRSQRRQLESSHEKIRWDSSDSSSGSNSSRTSPCPADQEPAAYDALPHEAKTTEDTEGDHPKILQDQEENAHDTEEVEQDGTPRNFRRKVKEAKHDMEEQNVAEKPPFVPYGWADKELETARKYTHNVRADNRYVYPSALKKQRLIKRKKTRREEFRAESRASVAAILLNRQKAIVNDVWMTEYQRCYSQASTRPNTAGAAEDIRKNKKGCSRPHSRKLKSR